MTGGGLTICLQKKCPCLRKHFSHLPVFYLHACVIGRQSAQHASPPSRRCCRSDFSHAGRESLQHSARSLPSSRSASARSSFAAPSSVGQTHSSDSHSLLASAEQGSEVRSFPRIEQPAFCLIS